MRRALVAAFVLSLAAAAVCYTLLPDEIASHFGRGGEPDGWSSRGFFVVMIVFIDVLMFAMFYWSPLLLDRIDKRFLSLPNRDYWLTDDRLPHAKHLLGAYMAEFGIATFALLIIATLATLEANLADDPRLREGPFVWFVFVYLAYTVVWCVRLIMAFRIPSDGNDR